MNCIWNVGERDLKRLFGCETLPLAAEGASSTASRVGEVASRQIDALGDSVSALTARALSLMERLPPDLLQKVATYFALQDWGNFSRVNKEMHALLNSAGSTREICPILYRGFEKLHQNVTNLNKLDGGLKLGLPEYKEPESIESIKRSIYILAQAGLIANLSEDGKAVIVTIPKDWSFDNLNAISQAAVAVGIPSASIHFWNESYRTIFQSSPVIEAQTIVISNTVIQGSRNQSFINQKALLKANGLAEEFPDALTVLTVAVLRRILTNGAESSYDRVSKDLLTYTRTNKMPKGLTLCVGSYPSCVNVHDPYWRSDYDDIGIGAFQKFAVLGQGS